MRETKIRHEHREILVHPMRFAIQHRSAHICLAALPLATIEHHAAIAHQAGALGLECCVLDATGDPGTAEMTGKLLPDVLLHSVESREDIRAHLRHSRSAAVFVQSPYPEHYPEWLWTEIYDRHLAYAGYGLNLSTWEQGLYGLETFARARYLLADSPFVAQKYLEHGAKRRQILLAGNPLLWELRNRLSSHRETDDTVLWAPHWTSTWFENARGFARWRETVDVMLSHATNQPSSQMTVRPHPLLRKAVESAATEPGIEVFQQLLALPNVTLSENSMVDDILGASRLLTDGVSIIAYFATTGRPLGVIRDQDSPRFNENGEAICAETRMLADADEIAAWLSAAPAPPDPKLLELSHRLHPTESESPIRLWARHAGVRVDPRGGR